MNLLINNIASGLFKRRIPNIIKAARNPFQSQEQVLYNLLRAAKDTEFGRMYIFEEFTDYQTFCSRVPIRTYEEMEPFISRMINGERDILWRGYCNMFAKSSGTTNAPSKYIPVTPECLEECHYGGAKDIVAMYLYNNPESKLFEGKSLRLGGSKNALGENMAVIGDLSAHLIENTPFWADVFSCPSKEIALIEDWQKKTPLLIKEALNTDIRSLSGVPSWMLVVLNKILEIEKKENLLEIWPNLELFFHGGINFSPYRERYEKIIPKGSSMLYYENYNASEGYFAAQAENFADDMLLLLNRGVFFEFVPIEEYGKPDSKAYPIYQVEKDRVYAVIISTNAGLWRYSIGDTVRFTSLSPYKIKIVGRTKAFINAFGEELMVENADTALKETCKQTDAIIEEYTAAPVFMDDNKNGAHQWAIEFAKEPKSLEKFADILDENLQKLNSDYAAKRKNNLTLRRLELFKVGKGTFFNWLKRKDKLGGQNKVPRLSNSRDVLEEILKENCCL